MPATTTGRSGGVNGPLTTLFRLGAVGGLADGDLLDRFARGGPTAESAFEALVARHGPMVLRVCRATLSDPHDAQDAFQATFLVLARRAGSIRRGSLGGWLFGVASRVSARASVDAARRRSLERRAAILSTASATAPEPDELTPSVRQEVARLPARYREAVVLCYLQGLTCEAAASRIGCPVGTVKTRLRRARDLLRVRLTRRGVALPAGLIGAGLANQSAAARPVASAAARLVLTTDASGRVAALTRGMLRIMLLNQLKFAAPAAVVALGIYAAGVAAMARPAPEGANTPAVPQAPRIPRSPEARAIHRALQDAETLEDPQERAEALFSLGKAQVRHGDLKSAQATLTRTLDVAATFFPIGPHPTPHVACRVAALLAEAGDRDGAHRAFERARRMIQAEDPQGFRGTDWSNLVAMQVAAEGRDAARETLDLYREEIARDKHANITIYYGESWARAKAGDFDGALRRLREGPHSRAEENSSVRIWMNLGIAGALQPGDLEAAGPILAEIRRLIDAEIYFSHRAPELAKLAGVLAGLGSFDEALATVAAISTPEFPDGAEVRASMKAAIESTLACKVDGYLRVGIAQVRAGDLAGARKSAMEALAIAAKIAAPDEAKAQDADELARARFMTAYFLIQVGLPDEARRLIDAFALPQRLTALRYVAGFRARAGDEAGARKIASEAVRIAEEALRVGQAGLSTDLNGIDQGIAGSIARLEARQGDPDGGNSAAMYLKVGNDGVAAMIARLEARHGDPAAARLAVGRIRIADHKDAALLDIAAGLAWKGDVAGAMAFAETLDSPRLRALAAIRAASTLREWNEP